MRALDPEKGVPGTPPGSSGGTAGLWVSSGRSWRIFGRVWGRSWRALGGSGGALGELWKGLGELWDVSERVNISKNSRSTAQAAVMLIL